MELCSKDEILANPINSYRNIHDFTSFNGCNYPYKDLKKPKGFTTESIYAHVFFRIST